MDKTLICIRDNFWACKTYRYAELDSYPVDTDPWGAKLWYNTGWDMREWEMLTEREPELTLGQSLQLGKVWILWLFRWSNWRSRGKTHYELSLTEGDTISIAVLLLIMASEMDMRTKRYLTLALTRDKIFSRRMLYLTKHSHDLSRSDYNQLCAMCGDELERWLLYNMRCETYT